MGAGALVALVELLHTEYGLFVFIRYNCVYIIAIRDTSYVPNKPDSKGSNACKACIANTDSDVRNTILG